MSVEKRLGECKAVDLVARTCDIEIGASGDVIPGMRYVGAPPWVGNVVIVLVDGSDYFCLGALGAAPPGATTGDQKMSLQPADHNGWLLANGSTFDGDEYPALATLLGGTTLPDLRGRYPVGADTNHTLGGTGGSRFLPNHAHTQPTHTHTTPSHSHTFAATAQPTAQTTPRALGTGGIINIPDNNHNHSVSGTTGIGGGGTTSPGGNDNTGNPTSTTVNSEPPWYALNPFIYAL